MFQNVVQKKVTPEGIEPPIFGSGIRRVTIAPWSQFIIGCASVAQWIEHQTSNLGVAGSSPAWGTFLRFRQAWPSVKALALGASLERGTGSNPVACNFFRELFPPLPVHHFSTCVFVSQSFILICVSHCSHYLFFCYTNLFFVWCISWVYEKKMVLRKITIFSYFKLNLEIFLRQFGLEKT